MMQPATATQLDASYEHQLVFFENHACEIKYGIGSSTLKFVANGQTQWSVAFGINSWHKFAIGVDYSAKTCELYYAGAGATSSLTRVSGPISAPGVSISDFHLGHLRLPLNNVQATAKETIYYSSVFISKDSVTTTPVRSTNNNNPAGTTTGLKSAAGQQSASTLVVAIISAIVCAIVMA